MSRGRKPEEEKIELRFRIRKDLYNELYLLLLDPRTNRMKYGDLPRIGEVWVKKWIEEQKKHFQRTSQ